ncbi:MAG: cysteine-rich CWC family protein [Candidatus Accumulibacter sp.]|nr:cysteine-rich CWC family protein [Accumulibacter sp.]
MSRESSREPENTPTTVCANCGASFVCGAVAGLSSCWCMQMPALPGVPDAAVGCSCPACLEQRVSIQPGAPAT